MTEKLNKLNLKKYITKITIQLFPLGFGKWYQFLAKDFINRLLQVLSTHYSQSL